MGPSILFIVFCQKLKCCLDFHSCGGDLGNELTFTVYLLVSVDPVPQIPPPTPAMPLDLSTTMIGFGIPPLIRL